MPYTFLTSGQSSSVLRVSGLNENNSNLANWAHSSWNFFVLDKQYEDVRRINPYLSNLK